MAWFYGRVLEYLLRFEGILNALDRYQAARSIPDWREEGWTAELVDRLVVASSKGKLARQLSQERRTALSKLQVLTPELSYLLGRPLIPVPTPGVWSHS